MSKMAHVIALITTIVTVVLSNAVMAATWTVNSNSELREQLLSANAGDTIILQAASYTGNFEITKALMLQGLEGADIDALGHGSAIKVSASDVAIEGLSIRNWGADLYESDAGIWIAEHTGKITINDNRLTGDGFGIRADHSRELTIRHNQISGNPLLHVLDRGDGIYLNRVKQAVIEFNKIDHVRDGVYIESSEGSLVANNRFYEQQYGIHYMYSAQDEAYGNVSENVSGGYAIMSSKSIYLHHNRAQNATEYGVLLNITNGARIEFNVLRNIHNPNGQAVLGNQGRAMFIYGALDNEIRGNEFAMSDIGIAMAMGGEKNRIYENNFINNLIQVKYVGDELLQWSRAGRGNYWSGYMGWDHTQDGIGDQSYQPNDSMDKLFWRYPEAKFLLNSPVVSLLRWVESQLTVFTATGIKDDYPLMQPFPINHPVESEMFESEFVYEQ
ncbi:nitrous oxide reductase family maturation protein NosD [Shewanella gelidimarina]|uniref:nitrous oxide reductase family maturation protein NosD n=1 Tax=Shewanella gelidimarina TaxID=56813 RepID=UPI00200D99E1|nr:nitrous oxide reductase family maturation protein NosD [Shewanella gelidimarina]MCL1056689.1 nitrous oxide reductase family maturation protein NosD [Shewanella gelidimarina]